MIQSSQTAALDDEAVISSELSSDVLRLLPYTSSSFCVNGWLLLFVRVDPESKWGTVVSNMVSEWSQQIGLILLTKKLIEIGSKESRREK
jgi:hypothetical protein